MTNSPSAAPVPEVSVVLPTYRSEATVGRCLSQLERQTFGDYELIVVDSSPDNACARVISAFRTVRLERSSERLAPQAARTLGARLARGRILVFTRPDVYVPPDWLEHVVAAVAEHGVVAGGLVCHGSRWLDQGIHLTRFSKWLPARGGRVVDVGPVANLALPRELFERLGGFSGTAAGDATLCWRLAAAGHPLWLVPEGWAEYHHRQTLRTFLSDRYRRGHEFAPVELDHHGGDALQAAFRALVTPLRLGTNLVHVARHALGAGRGLTFLWTLPIVTLGFAASLLGEAHGYGATPLHLGKLRGSVSS